jgi:hypothetical protein
MKHNSIHNVRINQNKINLNIVLAVKSSWAISCVIAELKTNVSETGYVSIIMGNDIDRDIDPDDGDRASLRNVGF